MKKRSGIYVKHVSAAKFSNGQSTAESKESVRRYIEKAEKYLPKKLQVVRGSNEKVEVIDWDSPIHEWEFDGRGSDLQEYAILHPERQKLVKQYLRKNKIEIKQERLF